MAPRTRLDDEVLELLADEPELLAIADAFAETQARRRRVRPIGVTAAIALVAAVAIAFAFWPGGGSSGISGNTAYAAVGGRLRVVEIRVVGAAQPFTLRYDRGRGELTGSDRSGSVRVSADNLPPATTTVPAALTRRFGRDVGPVLSLLLEYPEVARTGRLAGTSAPVRGYRRLRWVSYPSSLGYTVTVGLERGFLRPIVVVRGGSETAISSVSISGTN